MPDTLPVHRLSAAADTGSETGSDDVIVSLRRLVADRPDTPVPPLRLERRPGTRAAPLPPLMLTAAQRLDLPAAPAPAPELEDAALRALLARAVRDELRGDTGAHLTRKLRRLIREEITLALQSRDLQR